MKTRLHTILADHFTQMAKCHKAAMDASDDEDSPADAFHKSAMECCVKSAEDCIGHAKAEAADDLEKITMPMEVSAVATPPPSVRMVPRYGQQPLPTANENPIFAEVFGSQLGSDE